MQHRPVLSVLGRALGAAGLVLAALVPAGTAAAAGREEPPASGDPRAVASSGNAVKCSDVSLAGELVDLGHTVDESRASLDVTSLPEGLTVTGVVVKGGPAYNSYLPSALGPLPWRGLHAPVNPSGKPAQISHWFACAQRTAPPTGVPPTSGAVVPTPVAPAPRSRVVTPAPARTTSPPPAVTPGAAGGSAQGRIDPGPPSSPAQAAPAAKDPAPKEPGDLASTGFDGGWLVAVGGVLLLGGGALLASPRIRAALRRRS
ncbi:hypothetical protein [Streptoalloteichus hindustanus]|uniref:LPXTG-motif cell wall anchor domain-containing protein n=1 Tax=Streptoalloteichus hindustanus TaxID=2017 RepID=A0A1M5BG44_STRHI|nr:hypothetical protein [Streptoalloteichus hindustanus]SHF41461.1 hypothetical protein SAMN05444320_103556 [Streptoalloteichus hindustanus]